MEKPTALPPCARLVSTLAPERRGSMPCSPLAAGLRETLKLNALPLQLIALKAEALRASSQASIWRADTTGTPRAWAEATTASDSGMLSTSVWALTV